MQVEEDFGDEVARIVGDFAFDVADCVAAAHHFAFGAEAGFPHGAEEINF